MAVFLTRALRLVPPDDAQGFEDTPEFARDAAVAVTFAGIAAACDDNGALFCPNLGGHPRSDGVAVVRAFDLDASSDPSGFTDITDTGTRDAVMRSPQRA